MALTWNGVTGGTNADGTQDNPYQLPDVTVKAKKGGSVLDSAFANSDKLLGGLAGLWSVSQGNPYYPAANANGSVGGADGVTTPGSSGNNMLWIIIGVVVLLLLGFLLMRGKK